MEYSKIYQKFLNLYSTLDNMSTYPRMEPHEKCLLIKLNNYWLRDQKITVLEALDHNLQNSKATTHKYVKSLRSKGYLKLVIDEIDNRLKYVTPTDQTHQYFNDMGKLLVEASATAG